MGNGEEQMGKSHCMHEVLFVQHWIQAVVNIKTLRLPLFNVCTTLF